MSVIGTPPLLRGEGKLASTPGACQRDHLSSLKGPRERLRSTKKVANGTNKDSGSDCDEIVREIIARWMPLERHSWLEVGLVETDEQLPRDEPDANFDAVKPMGERVEERSGMLVVVVRVACGTLRRRQ